MTNRAKQRVNQDFNKSHPRSLEALAAYDSFTSSMIWRGRMAQAGDHKAMEQWARSGFISLPGRNDIREGDQRADA